MAAGTGVKASAARRLPIPPFAAGGAVCLAADRSVNAFDGQMDANFGANSAPTVLLVLWQLKRDSVLATPLVVRVWRNSLAGSTLSNGKASKLAPIASPPPG
jgi:hypothetical protein